MQSGYAIRSPFWPKAHPRCLSRAAGSWNWWLSRTASSYDSTFDAGRHVIIPGLSIPMIIFFRR